MSTNSILSILVWATFLNACATVERSSESGYNNRSSPPGTSQASDPTAQDTKIRLKQLENQLSSRRELEQYSKALPWFKNDLEKIDFLNSGNFEGRQKWLKDNDFSSRAKQVTAQMQEVVDAQDIALGMPDNLVQKAWGEPQSIEVSGKPAFRNQRWHYSKYISTPDGFKTENKTVYFEGGKVVGWELD